MSVNRYLLIGFILFAWALEATAQEGNEERALAIMQRHYEQMTTRNWRSDVIMQLVDRSGKVQTRHLKRLSKTDENDQEKYHLRFIDPPRIKNTTLLLIEQNSRVDDIWFYLPAIKKIKRIAGANLRASYMGTEFSFKDLKREKVNPAHNRYVFVEKKMLCGMEHHVIDAFPVSKEEQVEQGYKRRRFWIREDNHLAARIDFYDEDGDFLKTLVGSDMHEVGASGKTRYHQLTMTNRKGAKTIIQFQLLRINEEDPADKYFTKTYLLKNR